MFAVVLAMTVIFYRLWGFLDDLFDQFFAPETDKYLFFFRSRYAQNSRKCRLVSGER